METITLKEFQTRLVTFMHAFADAVRRQPKYMGLLGYDLQVVEQSPSYCEMIVVSRAGIDSRFCVWYDRKTEIARGAPMLV